MKSRAKQFLLACNLPQLLVRLRAPSALVLRYHSVVDDPGSHTAYAGGIVHSVRAFTQQMEYVAATCTPISMDAMLSFLSSPSSLPRRAVAVTFDDGYADNLHVAVPILSHFGIPSTVYVTASWVMNASVPWFFRVRHAFAITKMDTWRHEDGATSTYFDLRHPVERRQAFLAASSSCATLSGHSQLRTLRAIEEALAVDPLMTPPIHMLSPTELRALAAVGHAVGSHTMTHPNVAFLTPDALRWEITASKLLLEQLLQAPVTHFSYPRPILSPHYSDGTQALLRTAGYKSAVTCDSGTVADGCDPFVIPRIAVPGNIADFRWLLESTFAGRHPD